jgi:predicted GNAT family N-acyltransferase
MEVHVVEVEWARYHARLRKIRTIVFVHEQHVPEDLEWDGLDEDATHFLALDTAGRDVGCARLLPTGQIGRMAVLAAERNRGIGERLLAAAVAKAESLGFNEVFLHAQTHAVGFYERSGFGITGEPYTEAGIPHRSMTRLLAIAPSATLRESTLGNNTIPTPAAENNRSARVTLFRGEGLARDALAAGIAEARRELIIYSHFLDAAYFDATQIASAVSAFARRAPAARVRILIHTSQLIVNRGHRLLELARRMSSKVAIRLIDPEFDTPDSCFVSWDHTGFWQLPEYREPEGSLHADDPVPARRLFQEFEHLWEHGRTDPELRELRI